jgi:IS66 C-terminal element
MELDLRHHPPGYRPTGRLIEKAFEAKDRPLAWPPHRSSQQLPDVPVQILVGRKADRVLHVSFFQRLVQSGLAKAAAHRTAILCSLVQTCKHVHINPFVYLRDVVERVLTHPARLVLELTSREWKRLRRDCGAQAAA